MILAGEASGELHGAELIRALQRNYPEVVFEFFGSGGEQMRRAGAEVLVDVNPFGVIGPVEIARVAFTIYRAFRQLRDAARQRQPNAVILIDWPDFNLQFLKSAKRAGLRTIYYISPQIWAWRRYRLRTIKQYADKMIVILPFEVDFYRQAGVAVEFVGHPLVGSVRATKDRTGFCAQHRLDPQRPIVSLLPGSRRSEVNHIFPVMIETALRLRATGIQFLVPLASTVSRVFAESFTQNVAGKLNLTFIEQDTYNAVAHSDLAVVTSGTATLETALLETPLIVVYRGSELNYRLIRPLIHLDTFGMVNLIAGEQVAPELIQRDLNPTRLSEMVVEWVQDETRRGAAKEKLKQVKLKLGEGRATERAAKIVMETVGHRRSALESGGGSDPISPRCTPQKDSPL